ncbi:MAG: tRNA lysidine(34) synthetase TilS [Candidatus Latescibacterota bacterium]|nr:MAG: tRNA lysidine(34) synthetase TilS [Candidatus Latescibacterota bacterium]
MSLDPVDLRRKLLRSVARNLEERCRVARGSRLLVGVSGGSDSVALLRLLVDLAPELRLELAVAHFDHRMRPDSGEDAAFVRALAAEHALDFRLGTWEGETVRSETKARAARHDFLIRTARSHACDAIVLGHQLEDRIETVLMRLGRGTGIRGLVGIDWRVEQSVPLLRPALDIRRSTLCAYLHSISQVWREDPTNRDRTKTRNRVRHVALPALGEALGDRWLENWGAALDDLADIRRWLGAAADALLEEAASRTDVAAGASRLPSRSLQRETLRSAPEGLRRAALQRWLEAAGCTDLTRHHIGAASDLVANGQNGQEIVMPDAARLLLERGRVTLLAPSATETSEAFAYELELEHVLPTAAHAATAGRPVGDVAGAASTGVLLDGGVLPEPIEVFVAADDLTLPIEARAARPGERVHLLGAPGSRKVARILQDRCVPARLRRKWPLVADSRGIVWIAGVGVAERCRVRADSRSALRLRLVRARG